MNTQTSPVLVTSTIKARLLALMELLLEDSKFDKMTQTIIRNLAKNFFLGNNVTEEILREQITKIRDEIIPVILGEPPKAQ